jgi:CheY-like chemotaxis protein
VGHCASAKPLVLVIDDDPVIRSTMRDLLVAEGYSVAEASDGATAVDLAEQLQPGVIILDLALPKRSGVAVLNELKERRPTQEIPVLVVSAYAMLMLGPYAERAHGVIHKPFELAELLEAVERAARRLDPIVRPAPLA